ncbi:MAG: glycosyltransferase family 2 protein [Barnesiella sp.]|nr:glycosyltransferase family 2 protein [Barnesiella sp.]
MKSTSLIDIIIPVYNRATVVGKTLRSIEMQMVMPARVILVDNNSSDHTLDVLREWADKMERRGLTVKVLTESKPGAASARNRGLDESTAEYVMFFDSDDLMLPDHVESFADRLASHPEADVAGKSFMMTLPGGKRKTGYFHKHSHKFFNIFSGQFATLRYVARRSILEKAGLWNPAISGWDDIELGQRMLLLDPVITIVPGKPTVEVEVMPDSITESMFSTNPEKWERTLDEMRRTALEARQPDLVNWIDCRSMILAAEYSIEGAESEALRLREKVLARNPNRRRLMLVYRYHRRFRRFTWLLCRVIF